MSQQASKLKEGDAAPDFSVPDDTDQVRTLADFAGSTLVLYFYPKDDTSGCTAEACSFTENIGAFKKIKAQVVGVSKDSTASHRKFKEKYNLGFPLLSDGEGDLCAAYGVWVEKSMYGKKYMGIERSTFLIGPDGRILKIWRGVKVPGHVEEVMKAMEV